MAKSIRFCIRTGSPLASTPLSQRTRGNTFTVQSRCQKGTFHSCIGTVSPLASTPLSQRTRGNTFTPLYENQAVSCLITKRDS